MHEEYLGVVLSVYDQDVLVRIESPDGDVRETRVPLSAFGGIVPPQGAEVDCVVVRRETLGASVAVTTASVCKNPDIMYRDGLGLTDEQIERLSEELDV